MVHGKKNTNPELTAPTEPWSGFAFNQDWKFLKMGVRKGTKPGGGGFLGSRGISGGKGISDFTIQISQFTIHISH